jgi:hypothetical protein
VLQAIPVMAREQAQACTLPMVGPHSGSIKAATVVLVLGLLFAVVCFVNTLHLFPPKQRAQRIQSVNNMRSVSFALTNAGQPRQK